MNGIVYKSTGSWYIVKADDHAFYQARLKGKFKIKDITSTNPIAVGDEVVFDMEDEVENRTIITELLPRRNYVTCQ
jgi:ribosome biogenesis GTPase